MYNLEIITSKQEQYRREITDPVVEQWLRNPDNCCDIILRQINQDRMYDPIFAGRDNMTVVDFGANIGLFSLYARDSASRLVAVEPMANTFDVLTRLTDSHYNIERVQAAMANTDGPVTFYQNENSTVNSLLDRNGTALTVPGMTFAGLDRKSTRLNSSH